MTWHKCDSILIKGEPAWRRLLVDIELDSNCQLLQRPLLVLSAIGTSVGMEI